MLKYFIQQKTHHVLYLFVFYKGFREGKESGVICMNCIVPCALCAFYEGLRVILWPPVAYVAQPSSLLVIFRLLVEVFKVFVDFRFLLKYNNNNK